jgi:hypothetical protein
MAITRRRVSSACWVFVLAVCGATALSTAAQAALNRNVTQEDPEPLVRHEGDPPTGDADVDAAYDHGGDVFAYYRDHFGIDSWPPPGGTLMDMYTYSTFTRADGARTYFRFNAPRADDIVGRTLALSLMQVWRPLRVGPNPGFLVAMSGWQARQLEDASADALGEVVDLANGRGNDAADQRWLIGEDVVGEAPVRNMLHPEQFGHPGRVSDPAFSCAAGAGNGGSVLAHAFALMADGGTYNGQTIAGIGTVKMSQIVYRTMELYHTRASNFIDAYRSIRQSCNDLVGTGGITAANCGEVQKALDAVELDAPVCGVVQPELCPSGQTPTNVFFDDFETANSNWTAVPAGTGLGWEWADVLRHPTLPHNGRYSAHAIDNSAGETPMDVALTLQQTVTLPAGARLAFDSFVQVATGYDGGVVEYSVDGGATWSDALPLYLAGLNYSATPVRTDVGNPLGGRRAFADEIVDYQSTVYDLSSLAGRNVLVRFRWAGDQVADVDGSSSKSGWLVDDVRIYTCSGGGVGGTVAMASAAASVNEGAGAVALTITRAGGQAAGVIVAYRTNDGVGTAMAGSDYTSTAGTLTFAEGETSKTISVPIINDTIVDPAETFTFELTEVSGAGATLGMPSSTTVTIADNDGAAATQIQFALASVGVGEADGAARIYLTRTGVLTGKSTVSYATSDGGARAGVDYTAAQGTLTFAAGQSRRAFSVPITDDCLVQGTHQLTLTLSSPAGAALGAPATSTVVISDNDKAGTVRFAAQRPSVSESAGAVAITVLREGGTACGVLVDYSTGDGTALAGSDYRTATGTLSFGQGQWGRSFTVDILQDTAVEPTESFVLRLTNPQGGATLGSQSTAGLDIIDDENVVQFSQTGYEVLESGLAADILVTRAGNTALPATVAYETSAGTATPGADYKNVSGILTFAPGRTWRRISVPLVDDQIVEQAETTLLRLYNPGGAVLGARDTALLTIRDNDSGGMVQFNRPVRLTPEGEGIARVKVVRDGGVAGNVTVSYSITAETATANQDYRLANGTLTFAAGVVQQLIPMEVLQDTLAEGTETLTLTLGAPTGGATLGPQSTISIQIVDDEPAVEFAVTRFVTAEGGSAPIVISRTGDLSQPATVELATSGGSAVPGTDYEGFNGAVTFAAGVATRTINLRTQPNTAVGGNKTVGLILQNPNRVALGRWNAAELVITEDDAAGTISFGAAKYTVMEGGAVVNVSVARYGGSAAGASVECLVEGGGATAGEDFSLPTPNPIVITFAAGETSRQVSIPILDDAASEGPETIELVLRNPAGGAALGVVTAAVVTIEDDESQMIHLDTAALTVAEDACTASFLVSRHGVATGMASVDFAVTGGTATPGEDFMEQHGTLRFYADDRERTIYVDVCEDDVTEPPETVLITLSNPSAGVVLGEPAQAVLTIVDAVSLPGEINFEPTVYGVQEGALQATLCLVRSHGKAPDVSVTYATVGGSATAGSDYTATTGVITFAAGASCASFTVPLIDDGEQEEAESVELQLSNPTGGATLGPRSTATIWIVDND